MFAVTAPLNPGVIPITGLAIIIPPNLSPSALLEQTKNLIGSSVLDIGEKYNPHKKIKTFR
ncbi:MAG: hypothetical protein KH847_03905 [Clostridiales bacterium]|nr:hypothetical protein [Clostridiales bacterium]